MLSAAFLLCLVPACGARTPEYGIYFADDGEGAAVPMNQVSAANIDRAFAAACGVVGVNPHTAAQTGILLELHRGAITWESSRYAGATEQSVAHIAWYPCAFDPNSAMVHEFVHVALFAAQGNNDNGHTLPVWSAVDNARATLQTLCP